MKFCVTLACQRRREIEAKLLQYHRQADLIEVRLDYLQPVEVPRLPQGNGAEFVATCRPEREGGAFQRRGRRTLETAVGSCQSRISVG